MGKPHHYVAIDLGASNGRVMLGSLSNGKLSLRTVHRFEHTIQRAGERLCWDWPLLRNAVWKGLALVAEAVEDGPIASVSCDAWAQDFGLLDEDGELFYPPVSYRDPRTDGMPEKFAGIIPPSELLQRTGVTLDAVTALCQLRAMAEHEPHVLRRASQLLPIADLIHYELCGVRATDFTWASASQLYNLKSGQWDAQLLEMLAIPPGILPSVVKSPCVLGTITRSAAPHPALIGVPVVAGAAHDTAAASAALASLDPCVGFLSLGTWAMFGCCLSGPAAPNAADSPPLALLGLPFERWAMFHASMGLWPIQECRRLWNSRSSKLSHEEIEAAARTAKFAGVVDVSDQCFRAPADMLRELSAACERANLPAPQTIGETAKLCFDSLAAHCGAAASRLESATGTPIRTLRIVGGGSRNAYLCQRIADELKIPVLAGPAEATAIGNIILQARALNCIATDQAAAEVLRASFPPIRYEAKNV